MDFSADQLVSIVGTYVWHFARIAGMVTAAPIFNARLVPVRVRTMVAVVLTVAIAPMTPPVDAALPFSYASVLITAQQFLIGLAMGFTLQLIMDAMVIAGQTAAMSMGLGFAFMLDAQRGVSVPVLSQFFLIVATLTFLALDAHLVLIELLAQSFHTLPIGIDGLGRDGLWDVVGFASTMFAGGLQIALPAIFALLVVNIAFGVISRAAPTLNLFAIGFPASLLLGYFIILWSLPSLQYAFSNLLQSGFEAAAALSRN